MGALVTLRTKGRVSQRVAQLAPSGIRKFFDLISTMDNVISLGVGEPDFTTPWRIREAAIHAVERGHTHYTSNYGLLELRERLAEYLLRRYTVPYDAKNEILVTVGVSEGLDLAMRAILDPGDEVIIPEPSYVSYVPCVLLAGGVAVPVPTTEANQFRVVARDIEARVTSRTKAIVLSYPNNPTGAVMSRDELKAIGEVAKRHDLLVVSDEVYDRLVYGHRHVCFASLPDMRDRTIHLGGFSKDFAMTGWRVGYAAGPRQVIEAMMKVHQYTMLCAPTPSQHAALEALAIDDDEVETMVREYDHRRRLLVKGFRDIGLPCFEPQGAFYAFPSIKPTGLTSDQFAEALIKEEKVAVVPGSAFGQSGEGYIRCCYAVSSKEIEEAIERMGRFVSKRLRAGA
ncbi:MAG: aminotransferase class I/II-fold pyridoxal phosphate-dependent enzyme [Chloroflexi bacterium]|nr:aminotransferase class I/II-fold pyridoxal phosphate-dependent enzyme [Chloroflexota bacterium]